MLGFFKLYVSDEFLFTLWLVMYIASNIYSKRRSYFVIDTTQESIAI